MSLWNDDIEKAEAGKKIKITNGFVSEFKGEKQLSAGKFGKLEFLD
jgi:ssDNA-binding replication factor A large subunit